MRVIAFGCCVVLLACAPVARRHEPIYSAPADAPEAGEGRSVEPFRERCEYFEALEFGRFTVANLQGYAWQGMTGEPPSPVAGIQVVAHERRTGKLWYTLTGSDGAFAIPLLPPGDYEVWTCLDGFDELRFHVDLDPGSIASGVDLFVGPSEAPGRRDVVRRR